MRIGQDIDIAAHFHELTKTVLKVDFSDDLDMDLFMKLMRSGWEMSLAD